MRCAEWRELASGSLDGALGNAELAGLAAHLEVCEPCRVHLRRLTDARMAVGQLASRVAVPPALAARIGSEALRGPARRPLGRWVPVAASAAVVLVVLLGSMVRDIDRHLPDLCATLVEDHLRYLAVERAAETPSGDPAAVVRWFDTRLGFGLRVPRLAGATLTGGRVCIIEGQSVALPFFEHLGTRLSVFVLRESRLGGLTERHDGSWVGGMHGYHVRAVRDGDLTYALVGDLGEADLAALWNGTT